MAFTPENNNIGLAPVRLGLIGLGRWGQVLARVMRASPHVTLARIASSNPDAPSFLDSEGRLDRDWRDTLADSSLDGVVIATPPATHVPIALAALDAKLAVFIEKPLCLDVQEAESLLTAAERRGAVVFVDHVHLFHPAYRRLKTLIKESGGIKALRLINGNQGPVRDDASVLWDWGAHELALAMDLMGCEPEAVSARTDDRNGHEQFLDLSFPSGVIAQAHIGVAFDKRCRMVAAATPEASWVYDEHAPASLVQLPVGFDIAACRPGEPPVGAKAVEVGSQTPLDVAFADFAAAIHDGAPHLDGLRLGLQVVRWLSRC